MKSGSKVGEIKMERAQKLLARVPFKIAKIHTGLKN